MRPLLWILLIVGVFLLGRHLFHEMVQFRDEQEHPQKQSVNTVPDANLPGLPPSLEPSLETARKKGAPGLRAWLRNYRPSVQDPRLASIELDYVLLLSNEDPQAAKRLFQAIKARTPPTSPVYPRIKSLEGTYQ